MLANNIRSMIQKTYCIIYYILNLSDKFWSFALNLSSPNPFRYKEFGEKGVINGIIIIMCAMLVDRHIFITDNYCKLSDIFSQCNRFYCTCRFPILV